MEVAVLGIDLGKNVCLLARAHKNVAVVALANKMARVAWAVLRRQQKFAVGDLPRAA
jgi:hypothetical protein